MGNAITLEARSMWLMLRRDGGWWSASMLTHHWRPTFARSEVDAMLAALLAGNFIEERVQLSALNYCVTSSCLPLPGYSLFEETPQ